MKTCTTCHIRQDEAEFYKRSDNHGDGLQGTCKSCMKLSKKSYREDPVKRARESELKRKARRKDPDAAHVKDRRRNLRRCFGISPEEYDKMYTAQAGKCAICGQPEWIVLRGKVKRLAVDHCSKTGTVRGLLCSNCNRGLGMFYHDVDLISKATAYLLLPVGRLPR